jgi:hypothetical protein
MDEHCHVKVPALYFRSQNGGIREAVFISCIRVLALFQQRF